MDGKFFRNLTLGSATVLLIAISTFLETSTDRQQPVTESQIRLVSVDTDKVDHSVFTHSNECALCHDGSPNSTALKDKKGRSVAPHDLWKASMMANSSKDPFWRAVVSAEVQSTPSLKGAIEEKCTRCHAPMAAPAPKSPDGELLSYLQANDHRAELGMDGVSCTVCHQILPKGLGTKETFTGKFHINKERKIFGPHKEPFTRPMEHHVEYTPTYSNHMLESKLCSSCHTVDTHPVDEKGNSTSNGLFHEQSTYLEWRNSAFNNESKDGKGHGRTCQDCHMPKTDVDGNPIITSIAHNPGGWDFPPIDPRKPVGRHIFLGGNTLLKKILRDNAKELGVSVPKEAFDLSIKQSREFLRKQTAQVRIKKARAKDGFGSFNVSVRNFSGHKLPTAYPSRRVWVRVVVKDSDGKVVFRSGAFDAKGRLVDRNGDVLESEKAGGPVQPHFKAIRKETEVMVYQSVMADAEGKPTFVLLRAAGYLKDNRLLPHGWKKDHADAKATKSVGTEKDPSFLAGNDIVNYQFPAGPGRYEVEAALFYQVISPRYANELFEKETEEVSAFKKMYQETTNLPEMLSKEKVLIELR